MSAAFVNETQFLLSVSECTEETCGIRDVYRMLLDATQEAGTVADALGAWLRFKQSIGGALAHAVEACCYLSVYGTLKRHNKSQQDIDRVHDLCIASWNRVITEDFPEDFPEDFSWNRVIKEDLSEE